MKILSINTSHIFTERPATYRVELFNNTEEGKESHVVLSQEIKEVFHGLLQNGTLVTTHRPRRHKEQSTIDWLYRHMTIDINDCVAYVQNIRVTTTKDNPNVGIVTGDIIPFKCHDLFPDVIISNSLSLRTIKKDGKLSKVICLDIVLPQLIRL